MADNLTVQTFNESLPPPSQYFSFSPTLHVFVTVLSILLAIFIALTNGIIIVALIISSRRDQRRGRNVITKILMTSMSVTDAAIAVTVLPIVIYESFQTLSSCLTGNWCFIKTFLDAILSIVSVWHVAAMALDRYLAVCRPLMYRKMTKRIAYVFISIAWLVPSTVVGTVNTISWLHIRQMEINSLDLVSAPRGCTHGVDVRLNVIIMTAFFLYVPFLVLFILYILILLEVGRFHRRRSQLQARSTQCQSDNLHCSSPVLVLSNIATVERVQHAKTDNGQTQHITTRPPDTSTHDNNMLTTSQDRCPGITAGTIQTHLEENQSNASTHSCDLTDLCSERPSPDDAPPAEGEGHSCEQSSVAGTKQINTLRIPTQPIQQNNTSNLKAVRTVGSIVICFALCWLPYSIFSVVHFYVTTPACPVINTTLTWLSYLNSALNPIVYCSHRSIRKSVRDLICSPRLVCES